MCCPNISASFLTFSIITYVAIFTLTLLNMIFSILTPGTNETFKMLNFTDYSQTFSQPLLFNIDFGEKLSYKDDYGLSNDYTTSVCYTGYCKEGNIYYSTPDCTLACFNSLENCYDELRCPSTSIYCDSSNNYNNRHDPNNKCIIHNIIYKWRNSEIKKEISNIEFIPLKHIIKKGQNCESGYKQCGRVNNKDYLCLDDEYECPINKIVIDENITPPTDFNYKTKTIGDRYIHFTNENIEDFMYQDLYVDSDARKNQSQSLLVEIDRDALANLVIYNPYIYNGDYNRYSKNAKWIDPKDKAYLNQVKFQTTKTLEEMKKLQEESLKRATFTPTKIEEMNENVGSFTGALMGLGIASFSAFACIAIFFIPIYSANDCGNGCSKDCDCGLCQNITPMKRVLLFYIICSPTVIFSIFAFFVTLSKKSTYSEYSSMEYINEYKNYLIEDFYYYDEGKEKYIYFDKSITYNNAQFCVLLIIVILLILYPILVFLTSIKREESPSIEDINKAASTNNKKNKINSSTELNSYNNSGYNSSYSNNYAQPQQPIYMPSQPPYNPPPPQPVYQGEQPYYQQQYQPGALYGPQ